MRRSLVTDERLYWCTLMEDGREVSVDLNVRASYLIFYSHYTLTQLPFWQIEHAGLVVMQDDVRICTVLRCRGSERNKSLYTTFAIKFLSSSYPIVLGKLNQTPARPSTVKHFFFKTFVSSPLPTHFSYDLSVLEVGSILCVPFLWSNIRCFLLCWLTLSWDKITSFYFRGVWFHIFTLFQVILASRRMFMVRAVEMADSCSRKRISLCTCTINRVDFVFFRCL